MLPPASLVIDRRSPGKGFRHVLRAAHIRAFLGLLPAWEELAIGLSAIVLDAGSAQRDGWHRPGVIGLCAWPRTDWITVQGAFYQEHRTLFARLGVPAEQRDEGWCLKFDLATIRAYQLLHVLLHELGHHHDRMTTTRRRRASRGEAFAELYAHTHSDAIWDAYRRLAW